MNSPPPGPKVGLIQSTHTTLATTQQSRKGVIPTRIALVSDTHNIPLFESSNKTHAYRKPLPEADILVHAGDLTTRGSMHQYDITFKDLAQAKAEVKLIIAGNHDITLDRSYYRQSRGNFGSEHERRVASQKAEEVMDEARELWTGKEAKENKIFFLDEGVHSFTLSNGAEFSVYASPYTPEFCNWAFAYPRGVDRFNPRNEDDDQISFPSNPIPSFPAIDLIITHGPPAAMMDRCRDGTLAGCEALWRAVQRARPRLHVFGHIHESWGIKRVNWVNNQGTSIDVPESKKILERGWVGFDGTGGKDLHTKCPNDSLGEANGEELRWGEETIFVNAAIMNGLFRPLNAPWVVDLLLPLKE